MPSCQSLSSLHAHPPSPRLQALVPTQSSHSQTAREAIATTATALVSPSAQCSDDPTNGTSSLCSSVLLSSLPRLEAKRDDGIAAWRETCPLASLLSHHRCEEMDSAQNDRQETLQLFVDDLVETLSAGFEATEARVRASAATGPAQWTQPRQKREPQRYIVAVEDGMNEAQRGGLHQ